MDLFNRFPECKHQLQFISKINDEKIDSMEIDINEANGDILSQNNFKFENLQKVVHLRRRCLFLIIILITLIILTSYIIPNLLINLSLKLISTYSIKDKFVLKICYYLNDKLLNNMKNSMGIGDWGLEIGLNTQLPMLNLKSPITQN